MEKKSENKEEMFKKKLKIYKIKFVYLKKKNEN